MQEQIKRIMTDLVGSRNWQTPAITGAILLVAVMIPSLLFILALGFLLRALYLAYPLIKKQIEKHE